jgi:putative ABC transport system permease protein
MLLYNIKIAFRNFNSQKKISLLNIIGLSVGMSVAILIFYFVNFEYNYDNFHKDTKLIYRIISVEKGTVETEYRGFTPLPLPEVVRAELKNVEMTTSLSDFLYENTPVQVDNRTYFNLTGYTADSCLLKMFNFPLVSGNANTIFDDLGSVVLTQSTSKKLFGNENPIGKVLIINKLNFTVSGIMKDLPENSIFKFNLLVSHLVLKKIHPDLPYLWWYGGPLTFIKVHPNQNLESIKSELASIPAKYFPDFMKGRETYDLQPLEDIHLNTKVVGDVKTPVSPRYLGILLLIAISVMFIACTNFVNLSTSQSEKRTRETGIRKLSGGGRFQIISIFIAESVTLSMIALVVAVYLATLFLPWFNELSQSNMIINFTNGKILLLVLLFGILTGILSGIYPALLFSRYKPVQMLRSNIINPGNKTGFRKVFIITQFLITILLIIAQLFITRQVSFMKNHTLGFNEKDLISVPLHYNDENKRLAFAKLFIQSLDLDGSVSGIKGSTLSENVPGQFFSNRFAVVPEGSSPDDSKEMIVTSIDENFSSVFQVPLINGRNFSGTIASDRSQNVLINETAAYKLGWDNPIGKQIRFKHEKESVTVIGVLKDINFRSLQTPVEPEVYRYAGENWLAGFLTFRLDHLSYLQAINHIKSNWEKLVPDLPFQYTFIKDKYNESYREEERLSKIVGTFAMIAIFLSCLGLFAMIAHLSVRRTKEIGIRKINGARIIEVMLMLSRDFIIWVSIAFIFACPIAWLAINNWLEIFAFRTRLNLCVFVLGGLIALGIALLTVGFQSWRAATRNPVEALRYE